MEIVLNRNLNSKKDVLQEEDFSQTMNFNLFFNSNKIIAKVDSWKYSNVKSLLKEIKRNIAPSEIILEYSNWNKNIEFLFTTINTKDGEVFEDLSYEEKEIFLNRDSIKIHDWIKQNIDNKNKQFKALLFICELTNNNYKVIDAINNVVNNGISTIMFAIDFTLPLLFVKEK